MMENTLTRISDNIKLNEVQKIGLISTAIKEDSNPQMNHLISSVPGENTEEDIKKNFEKEKVQQCLNTDRDCS